jgi:hypothetical protein
VTEKEDLRKLLPERFTPGLSLLLMEEYAREMGRQMAREAPRPEVIRPREIVTRTVDKRNYAIRHTFTIIDASVPGKLDELTIVSPSTNFSILIMTDGVQRLSRSYSELLELSPHSMLIDAFEDADNGVYVLHIKEVYWLDEFSVRLYVDSATAITFKQIWASWQEKVIPK